MLFNISIGSTSTGRSGRSASKRRSSVSSMVMAPAAGTLSVEALETTMELPYVEGRSLVNLTLIANASNRSVLVVLDSSGKSARPPQHHRRPRSRRLTGVVDGVEMPAGEGQR